MAPVMLDLDDPESVRRELRSFLRIEPPRPPSTVEVLSSSQEDGYLRHLVHLVTEDDVIPAFLAVPSGAGPFPAVVVFHQHAGQRHFGKSEVGIRPRRRPAPGVRISARTCRVRGARPRLDRV